MCGTIRGQYYRFTIKTKIFVDFVKNRKKRYGAPRGWTFFLYRKTIGCGTVRQVRKFRYLYCRLSFGHCFKIFKSWPITCRRLIIKVKIYKQKFYNGSETKKKWKYVKIPHTLATPKRYVKHICIRSMKRRPFLFWILAWSFFCW